MESETKKPERLIFTKKPVVKKSFIAKHKLTIMAGSAFAFFIYFVNFILVKESAPLQKRVPKRD
jgi:hypothetical protein